VFHREGDIVAAPSPSTKGRHGEVAMALGDRQGRTVCAALSVQALAVLAGCAPAPLTPAGARVALTGTPGAGCSLVAALRGSAGYNGRSGETNAADVEIYLRNQAAEHGGDALVITSRRLGASDDSDTLSQPRGAGVSGGCPNCVALTANAYRCRNGTPVAATAARAADVAETDPPFATKAAEAAMAAAASSARGCRTQGGPTGEARVTVTFATTGDVVYSEAEGTPFAGSATGECIARKFRNARVPPFSGQARSLTATVRIIDE
jgi:hypothetical protein